MELKEALIKVSQSETSGSNSSSRFQFQRNWAISELLKRHLNDENYIFIFEYHDDVLILTGKNQPSNIEFIQVKTKDGNKNWTVNGISKGRKLTKSYKNSYLTKLCENKLKFIKFKSKLRFVTNKEFSFDLKNNHEYVSKLDSKTLNSIVKNLKKELPAFKEEWMKELLLQKTNLALEDHEVHLKGKLNEFCSNILGVDHKVQINNVYRVLSDDIQRKNNYPQNKINDYEELIKKKGVTKKDFNELLDSLNTHDISMTWDTIRLALNNEGINVSRIIGIQKNWGKVNLDLLDYQNVQLHRVKNSISKYILNNPLETLGDLLDNVNKQVSNDFSLFYSINSNYYLDALILWVKCE